MPWHIERQCSAGRAIAEARRRSESSCLSRSVRTTSREGQFGRAVVQRFSWRHRLRALRKVADRLPDRWPLRPDARAVVCPGRCPNAKFAERSVAPAGVDSATEDTSLAIEPTHLAHTVFKLTSVLLPRMLHETSICRRRVSVGNWATLRAAEVLPGHLFRFGWSSGIPHCWRWRGWQSRWCCRRI